MKVGDRKFDQIISRAQEYCSAAVRSRQVQVPYDVSAAGRVNMDDDRALIAVSSNIEAESNGKGKHFSPTWRLYWFPITRQFVEAKWCDSGLARELERGLIR